MLTIGGVSFMQGCKGYKWYNNGIEDKLLKECPQGWIIGRLSMKDEVKEKHRQNTWTSKMTQEERKIFGEKIKQINSLMTKEQREHKSLAISKKLKGKYKGSIPWNKGKKGCQKAWNKGMHTTQETKDKFKETIRNRSEEKKNQVHNRLSKSLKGRIPWNKDKLIGPMTDVVRENMLKKEYRTKKENNSFNISKPEENYYRELLKHYSKEDIIKQYNDEQYPYSCDFYIISKKLYIELNLNWTHGGHPFNETDSRDLQTLAQWRKKAQFSDYYKNAIYTWTDLDVRKQKIAFDNKLNYKYYYTFDSAIKDIDNL